MKILYITSSGHIASIADDFVFGESDEVGVDKWHEVRNGEQVPHLYYLGDFASATITNAPEDLESNTGKYLYLNGQIVRNPDWQPPEEPVEARLNRLEEAMAELAEMMFGGEL